MGEILIAGAGVSGLTAAINLKLAGRQVRVIERSPETGAQRFPDWDAVENWTSLEDLPQFFLRIGLDDRRFRYSGQARFTVIDPYGRRYEVSTPRPFFYLVKRGAVAGGLEQGLRGQARELEIPIDYGVSCPPGKADIWAAGSFGQGTRFFSAGFQDFLWGFGIRHALTSGYLAAQAILAGRAWQELAEREIRALVRASLVNRWLYDRMPNPGYALLVRRFARDPDLNALVSRWYHPRRIHRLLWPLVERQFRREVAAVSRHERYRNRTRQKVEV